MAYFLRDLSPTSHSKRESSGSDSTSSSYSQLLRNCLKLPTHGHTLRLQPDAAIEDAEPATIVADDAFDARACQVVAAPSSFGANAIARSIVLRYAPLLKLSAAAPVDDVTNNLDLTPDVAASRQQHNPVIGSQVVSIGLSCLFSVLGELNKREPQLCCDALTSLLQLLQNLPPEGLRHEPYASVQKMFSLLRELRANGCASVSTKASSCLVGLAVAYGLPEFLLLSSAALLCDKETENTVAPVNYRRLTERVARLIGNNDPGVTIDWWTTCLTDLHTLCGFDLTKVTDDSSPETPDERKLCGAIACEGKYIYILTCYGLFKYGSGFGETILGKEYASNTVLKAGRGSWLVACNGSLYLRRRQSSRLWVLDTDCLREIGEILLPSAAVQGSLLSDGNGFHLATVDESWNLVINALDDSFSPIDDPKSRQKHRLTEVSFGLFGESSNPPHSLTLTLPKSLQTQAADFQLGKDIAVLLARSGKVYYAGRGSRIGLQDTNDQWMELVLPEPIVALSVSQDADNIVLRSGAGHVWIAGVGPDGHGQTPPGRMRAPQGAKLRRLVTPNRKKCLSVAAAAGCIAYVTENGRAFISGRHAMHCHPESGQILGLEHVHLATVSIGKTHAVAISRHGHVYTWGLNNLNQCGRSEVVSSVPRSETESVSTGETSTPNSAGTFQLCGPTEHMWVKDVPTICIACGLCTARGARCPARVGSPARGSICLCGQGESGCLRCGVCRACGERSEEVKSDKDSEQSERSAQRMILNPSRVILRTPNDAKVSVVSCGNYHTILLAADGQVYTFGSNCHGQLGVGDTKRRAGPQKLDLSASVQVVQVAAGSNHCVLRAQDGMVYTFGAHRQGQLGRHGDDRSWHSSPGAIEGFGQDQGRIAGWIGAAVDVTLVQIHKQVFSNDTIADCQITANNQCLIVFPNQVGQDYVVIRKKYAGFHKFALGPAGLYTSWCLDPSFNVMWRFNAAQNRVEALSRWPRKAAPTNSDLSFLKGPEFWVPNDSDATVSSIQLGLSVLATTYAMTSLSTGHGKDLIALDGVNVVKEDNYYTISRFQTFGGGWGYSAHSVEAIQFQASKDVVLVGVGLFGGRGEYIARLRLMHLIGADNDEQNVELIAETDEMLYDCAPKEKAHLSFNRPILCKSGHWYIIWTQINGPSSDCGASGQSSIPAEDGTLFTFRNSRLSNNGTDVNVGQIPELLYHCQSGEHEQNDGDDRSTDLLSNSMTAPIPSIRAQSLLTVTVPGLGAVFDLLRWAIDRALTGQLDQLLISESSEQPIITSIEDCAWAKERAVAIGIVALRLVAFYVRVLYPATKSEQLLVVEPKEFSGLIIELSAILSSLFDKCSPVDSNCSDSTLLLLDQAVDVYVQCAHVLLPCPALIQDRLATLMASSYRDWSLVALLKSLCVLDQLLPTVLASADRELDSHFPDLAGKMFKITIRKRDRLTNLQNVLRFFFELAFASAPAERKESSWRLKEAAQRLIASVARELVTPNDNGSPPLLQTPNRFRRSSSQPNWDMSSGAADAIAFRVDSPGIVLNGFAIFVGGGTHDYTYNCEVLLNQSDSARETWQVLEKTAGAVSLVDYGTRGVACVRLNKPVKLVPNGIYAVRLYLHGGKTFCGEGGSTTVRLVNGAKLIYQPCSLSLNGTTVVRGQIPFLLYSISDNSVRLTAERDQLSKWFLLLLRMLAAKVTELVASNSLSTADCSMCSQICGYTMLFLEGNPKKALDVVAALDELLPMVASSNGERQSVSTARSTQQSSLQTVIESAHPYSSCRVTSQVVAFDKSVQFVGVEFSENCCTMQAEDCLWLYVGVDKETYVPVGRFSGLKDWPERVLLLPGNSLWFVLETTTSFEEATPDATYGFRCTVTGFCHEEHDIMVILEQELTWICSSACRLLVQVTNDQNTLDTLSIAEEETQDLIQKHGSLLRRGLNLAHVPTVNEILKNTLPGPALTAELKFLRDFIAASGGTVAGFLSRWLFSEPVIDLQSCELFMPEDDIFVGHPTSVCLIPRDQHGRLAVAQQMTVEVTVRTGASDYSIANGQQALPSLAELQADAYQPIYLNKARYISITMMETFTNYSFEEMRLGYFRDAVLRENVRMVQKQDSSYSGHWIPKQSGVYRIECKLDGFQLPQSYQVEVQEASSSVQEVTLRRTKRRVAQLSRARLAICDTKIMTKGIRIRASPSMTAQQVGILPRGCTISYIEELDNVEGCWLRLTDEASVLHCDAHFPNQAWCLQYSKPLKRAFLIRSSEPDFDMSENDNVQSIMIDSEEIYYSNEERDLIICSNPSVTSATNETIAAKAAVKTDGWLHNREGIWVKLAGVEKFILAQDSKGHVFLERRQSFADPNTAAEDAECSNNGNEETTQPFQAPEHLLRKKRPIAQVPPTPSRNGQPVKALRPSIVDCSRSVFAAFLWHERLVKDAMACSAYLKYHPELHSLSFDRFHDRLDIGANAPAPLQPLYRLWQETNQAVQSSIQQHLILPSPPAAIRPFSSSLRPLSTSSTNRSSGEELCELCEEYQPVPVTTHMRLVHGGCGGHSGGHGYNSLGKYTSGWSGNCGDGGRTNATWYLMCAGCRARHLRSTPSGQQHERSRRWRAFRMTAGDVQPQTVMKRNAMFLLELNQSNDGDSKDTSTAGSGWTINLFPQATTPPALRSIYGAGQSEHASKTMFVRTTSHASDPGPKHQLAVTQSAHGGGETPGPLMNRRRMTSEYEKRQQSMDVLRSPSVALKSLVNSSACGGVRSQSGGVSTVLRRPVLAFVIQHHDLKKVKEAMRTSVARATFFAHAFRVWNWLLRLVSTEASVSDILWHYLTALSSYNALGQWFTDDVRLATKMRLIPHPWRVCFLAGPIGSKMVSQLHSFLYTISVILQSNCVEPSLRSLCFRAWTFQLTMHEQDLLILTCNILATVGQVLSDPTCDNSWLLDESNAGRKAPEVKILDDLTHMVHIDASSRQAMAVCLTDCSSETFWESGEEDKNRAKTLVVRIDEEAANPLLLAIHIDNQRDEGYRTSYVSIMPAPTKNQHTAKRKLHTEIIDQQFVGWIKCCIAGAGGKVQIELKGTDHSIRIRQICVSGVVVDVADRSPSHQIKPSPSHQLLFSSAQADAFALFQAIAAQAFSDEFAQEQNGTLRQQVLDLLFSRVQLQPLQTYVCSQIVNALEREVALLRDKSKKNYSYCCGLMVMLVKICASRHGLEVFSVRNNLLTILSEMMLFAPQVVQCQVLETIERVLRLFKPHTVDVKTLTHKLLAVVSKVLSMQIRQKATHTVCSATMQTSLEDIPSSWRMDRPVSIDIGRLVRHFLVEASSADKFGPLWATAFRTEIANHVMFFSTVPKTNQTQAHLMKSGRFWLGIAALSVLRDNSWLELSATWQGLQRSLDHQPDPLCDNHDDGKTTATLHCEVCLLSLCRECYAVLHLNKRNRNHTVQLIDGSEGNPQIEIHEGCTRFRLPWLLILFHGSTLNGMVEFSLEAQNLLLASPTQAGGGGTMNGFCRFCQNPVRDQLSLVCSHADCQTLSASACPKLLSCGHICGGIADEDTCLPCLQCHKESSLRQDADDLCVICFTDRLGGAPSIQLICGHVFHFHCVRTTLSRKWSGPRIHFGFMQCPLCKRKIEHPGLEELLRPLNDLFNEVANKAKLRLEYDGLLDSPALTSANSQFFGDPLAFAMDKYVYVLCHKCGKAYFGGESQCQQALDTSQYNPEELVCGACSDVAGAQICGRHGTEYLEYKCRFCCSVAVYFCFGTTHFCTICHDDFQRLMALPKQLLPKCPAGPKAVQLEGSCPLKVQHPETGEEFALGCGICRNLSTF